MKIYKEKNLKFSKDANKLERHIHNKYSNEKINSNHMERYHTKSGGTECYPLDMFEKLSDSMEISFNLVQ